jgi:hypothetical protein
MNTICSFLSVIVVLTVMTLLSFFLFTALTDMLYSTQASRLPMAKKYSSFVVLVPQKHDYFSVSGTHFC